MANRFYSKISNEDHSSATLQQSKWLALCALYLRLALAVGFLSAVADRFGLLGSKYVLWGDFQTFIEYTQEVNIYIPMAWVPILSLLSTIGEIVLAVLLALGVWTRYVAIAAGILLLLYAVAMSVSMELKQALNYSVYIASSAAFLLSCTGAGKWSIDGIFAK